MRFEILIFTRFLVSRDARITFLSSAVMHFLNVFIEIFIGVAASTDKLTTWEFGHIDGHI